MAVSIKDLPPGRLWNRWGETGKNWITGWPTAIGPGVVCRYKLRLRSVAQKNPVTVGSGSGRVLNDLGSFGAAVLAQGVGHAKR